MNIPGNIRPQQGRTCAGEIIVRTSGALIIFFNDLLQTVHHSVVLCSIIVVNGDWNETLRTVRRGGRVIFSTGISTTARWPWRIQPGFARGDNLPHNYAIWITNFPRFQSSITRTERSWSVNYQLSALFVFHFSLTVLNYALCIPVVVNY